MTRSSGGRATLPTELSELIEQGTRLSTARWDSREVQRWKMRTRALLEQSFGADSQYAAGFGALSFRHTGLHAIRNTRSPEREVESHHQEAFGHQLETALGILEAAGDQLMRSGVAIDASACNVSEKSDERASDDETRIIVVLFTDIVDSTRRKSELGDHSWRELLDRHNALVAEAVERHHGRVVKNTGDGFLVSFAAPRRAIGCALQIVAVVKSIGLEVRAGLHAGEVELEHEDDDLFSIVVDTAARVITKADPGEVMISSTLREIAAGSEFGFIDRGRRRLKGLTGRKPLFAVVPRRPTANPNTAAIKPQKSRREALIRLELQRDERSWNNDGVPCFYVALRATNQGSLPATWLSFQLALPFLPPRFSQPVGQGRVIHPVVGRGSAADSWIPYYDDETGSLAIRFISPANFRVLPGRSHILAELSPRIAWYGLRWAGDAGQVEPLNLEVAPKEVVYGRIYELECDPGPSLEGRVEFPLFELKKGYF